MGKRRNGCLTSSHTIAKSGKEKKRKEFGKVKVLGKFHQHFYRVLRHSEDRNSRLSLQ
jgi:hypothetical protein